MILKAKSLLVISHCGYADSQLDVAHPCVWGTFSLGTDAFFITMSDLIHKVQLLQMQTWQIFTDKYTRDTKFTTLNVCYSDDCHHT